MRGGHAQAPRVLVGRDGFAVGWHGPLGPCVARFEAWTRERPLYARALGHAGADLPVVPALWLTRGSLVAIWCEGEGAFAQAIDDGGGARDPLLVHAGATAIALARSDDRATLFCADERGIVRVELDAAARPLGPARRCDSERRAGAVLSAARVRDQAVCAFVHRGGSSLGVIATRGAEELVVRHPIAGSARSVAIASSGGRAGVAVEQEGDRVLVGVLGPDGKFVERPRPALERTLLRAGAPRVVWTEDAFTLLVHERAGDRLHVAPLGPSGVEITLPRCEGPFAAAYWAQHFFALEVSPDEDGAELRLWRFARDGSGQQERVSRVDQPDAAPRRTALAARRVLTSLSESMARAHGYRDVEERPALSPDGATLTLLDGDGRLTVTAAPYEERVRMRVASTLGDDARLPEAPSSLVRLARWVKERLSSVAREQAAADRAWAEALAAELDAAVLRMDRAGAALVLELVLAELPLAARLDRWLRRLRDEHAGRAGPA